MVVDGYMQTTAVSNIAITLRRSWQYLCCLLKFYLPNRPCSSIFTSNVFYTMLLLLRTTFKLEYLL